MTEPLTVIVPIKGLQSGKSRLGKALTPDRRLSLNTFLSAHTLDIVSRACPHNQKLVISPDPDVRELADAHGMRFTLQQKEGLNAALSEAAQLIEPQRTIYIVADLPLLRPDDIRALAETPGIAIAPDEGETGTNALSLPSPNSIEFEFGSESFDLHLTSATETRSAVEVVRRPGLAFDLDTEADLSRLEGWP